MSARRSRTLGRRRRRLPARRAAERRARGASRRTSPAAPHCRREVAELRGRRRRAAASPCRRSTPPPELKRRGSWPSSTPRPSCSRAAGSRADEPERGAAARAPRRSSRAAGASRAALALRRRGAARWRSAWPACVLAGGGDGRRAPWPRQVAARRGAQAELVARRTARTLACQRTCPRRRRPRLPGVAQAPGQDPSPTPRALSTPRRRVGHVAVPGSLDGVEAVLVTTEPRGRHRRRRRSSRSIIASARLS